MASMPDGIETFFDIECVIVNLAVSSVTCQIAEVPYLHTG